MFKALHLGGTLTSILMLIPTLLAITVIVLGASLMGALPKQINDPVLAAERMVAQQFLSFEVGDSSLRVTSITITPAVAVGHATVALAVSSSVALPADSKPVALKVMVAAANHFSMPFGISPEQIDAVTVSVFGPDATKPAMTATIDRATLLGYKAGSVTQATLLSKIAVK